MSFSTALALSSSRCSSPSGNWHCCVALMPTCNLAASTSHTDVCLIASSRKQVIAPYVYLKQTKIQCSSALLYSKLLQHIFLKPLCIQLKLSVFMLLTLISGFKPVYKSCLESCPCPSLQCWSGRLCLRCRRRTLPVFFSLLFILVILVFPM